MAKMFFRTLAVGPFGTNCYLAGSEATRDGMVIDPADQIKRILANIKELDLNVKIIVATHGHMDHIGAVRRLKEATGAVFAVHADEVASYQNYSNILNSSFGVSFDNPPIPDRTLRDNDIIEVGDLQFKVLHTPGHSPGGISIAGYGVVFCGDTLFNYGVGRTDFPGCSHAQLIQSIRTRLLTLPDETIVLPGHGPKTTIGEERKRNPFLRE